MRHYHLLLPGLLLALISCTNNKAPEQQYVPLKDVLQQQYPSTATGKSTMFNTAAGADSAKGTTVPGVLGSAPPAAGQVAINPPHGQPGHRCEIPVGMPLDSKPADASANNQAAASGIIPVNNTSVTAKGLNPPHGQPGHRCDIAVGAPLDSKPVTSPVQNAVATTTPKGMNPPHGQPGHRCDIAVGAPLNSKPAQPVTPLATTKPEPVPPATNCVTGTEVPKDGLNPEHGKPGHRCDVNVGSPLASKPAPSLADKLNPPHGQSGHRCDIAVGAFIDSPKATDNILAASAKDSSKS
ncbi:MAG: hypothetical protein ACM3VS_04230 [Candidatus Dadabacteria bacterium]